MGQQPATTRCDTCEGTGKTHIHLNYSSGRSGWKWVDCLMCDGSGTVSPEKQLQIKAGRRLRDRRKETYRSLRDEAIRLGIGFMELSQAENGRLPLTRVVEIEAMK
jgi:DnaJ-class molecular chaperone